MKTRQSLAPARVRGFTLVELMVGMALGLVVVGIVVNILMSNLQTYRVNEDMGRLQESARTSFELMARDVREAGQNSCGARPQANVIRSSSAVPVWADMAGGSVKGYEGDQDATGLVVTGTSTGQRVSGTDALLVIRAAPSDVIVTAHNPTGTVFTVSSVTGFAAGDPLVVCDATSAAVFQVGTVDSGAKTLNYNLTDAPMNCSTGLDYPGYPIPAVCTGFANKTFAAGGFMAKLASALWYIGNNADGGRSLYRTQLSNSGGVVSVTSEEIVPNVQDLQVKYLTANVSGSTPVLASDWVDADSVTDWSPSATDVVVAARLDVTLHSPNKVGTDAAALERHLISVVGLRNRETR